MSLPEVRFFARCVAVGLLLSAVPLATADLIIDWFTIDAGGTTSAGGTFEMNATIAQIDAGTTLTGDTLDLTGGFWPGALATADLMIDWFTIDAGGSTSAGGTFEMRGTIAQPDTDTTLTGDTLELSGGFWPGALDPPALIEAFSAARHAADGAFPGGTIEFPIDPVLGLVEPREQDAPEMSIRLVFDGAVNPIEFTVSVAPDPGLTPTVSAGATANELNVAFDGTFPIGRYDFALDSGRGDPQTFSLCYLQGDVNCSGDTTGLDLAAIQSPGNWNLDLSQGANPRADVNRDGQVTGTDLGKVQHPAFWNQPVPPLTCTCP